MRDHIGVRHLVIPGRDLNNIHIGLKNLGHLNALFNVIAAGLILVLRPAHPKFKGKIGPHCIPHCLHQHQGKAGAVFQLFSAVLIFPGVGAGQELMQQPAVAAMDQNHLKAADLRPPGAVCISFCDGVHDLLGHLLNLKAADHILHRAIALNVPTYAARAPVCHIGVLAAMGKLQRGCRPVTLDRIHQIYQAGDRLIVINGNLPGLGFTCGPVYNAFPQGNGSRAALGLQFIIGNGLWIHVALRRQAQSTGRCRNNTVF